MPCGRGLTAYAKLRYSRGRGSLVKISGLTRTEDFVIRTSLKATALAGTTRDSDEEDEYELLS